MDKHCAAVELISSEQISEEVRRSFERTPDAVCRMNGKIYLMMDRDVLCCEDTDDGRQVISAVRQKIQSGPGGVNPKDAWYQIITVAEPDRIAALAKKHGIEFRKKRTAVLFRVKNPPDQPLDRIFGEIAPLEEEDRIVAVDRETLALIRESAFRSEEEIAEYLRTCPEYNRSENYWDAVVNSAPLHDLGKINISDYPNGTLYRYSCQRLERIIDLIPAEQREKLIQDFHSGNRGESLDEETMETIRVFFRNDLSITAASRELFIHRNTLIYRLDKIRRDTGLDLRTFEDAVIFRLICGMTGNT